MDHLSSGFPVELARMVSCGTGGAVRRTEVEYR